MLPYQERVVEEKQELDKKLSKLNLFIRSESNPECGLDKQEYALLQKQSRIMLEYSDVLMERILAFK